MEKRNILLNAIDTYGRTRQTLKAIEELNECAAALARNLNAMCDTDEVCDELADVQIMLDQMRMIYDSSAIDKRVEYKIRRLMDKLNSSAQSN